MDEVRGTFKKLTAKILQTNDLLKPGYLFLISSYQINTTWVFLKVVSTYSFTGGSFTIDHF